MSPARTDSGAATNGRAWAKYLRPMGDYASTGLVFYLFGLFCAYWAQESGRSPWTWFLLGWLFAPFTGLFLLMKNSEDLKSGER